MVFDTITPVSTASARENNMWKKFLDKVTSIIEGLFGIFESGIKGVGNQMQTTKGTLSLIL